jgi:hypothetical protein
MEVFKERKRGRKEKGDGRLSQNVFKFNLSFMVELIIHYKKYRFIKTIAFSQM